jgi:hypothetical protein
MPEEIHRPSLDVETTSQASCNALAQSIEVTTAITAQGKLEAEAGLDACRNAGYISSGEYTALMKKLSDTPIVPVPPGPVRGP